MISLCEHCIFACTDDGYQTECHANLLVNQNFKSDGRYFMVDGLCPGLRNVYWDKYDRDADIGSLVEQMNEERRFRYDILVYVYDRSELKGFIEHVNQLTVSPEKIVLVTDNQSDIQDLFVIAGSNTKLNYSVHYYEDPKTAPKLIKFSSPYVLLTDSGSRPDKLYVEDMETRIDHVRIFQGYMTDDFRVYDSYLLKNAPLSLLENTCEFQADDERFVCKKSQKT